MEFKYNVILVFFLLATSFACSTDNVVRETFEFDTPGQATEKVIDICIVERQCFGDPFASSTNSGDEAARIQAMIDYLKAENIPVYDVSLEVHYFEAVCEACYVCPSGDRFHLRTDASAVAELLARDIWIMDCPDDIIYRRVTYNETKCSDAWAGAWQEPGYQSPFEKKNRISSFLLDRDIDVFEIQILPGEGQACEACNCWTGNRFELLIDEQDLEKASQFGFTL